MFWFLHYLVKVAIGLALVGTGAVLYANRQWFSPLEDWVVTLRRAHTETLPILGESVGRVVRVPTGDTVTLRDPHGKLFSFRIAGVQAPPWSRNPRSEGAEAFRRSRDRLASITLSNDVRVAYTFFVPEGGGLGGVYVGTTNVALPLLDAGTVIVHDASLKSLPVKEQVELLAAEKMARNPKR